MKTFSDVQKLEEFIASRHISRIVKGSPVGRMKMMPDGNMLPHEEMKSTGNGNYMHK